MAMAPERREVLSRLGIINDGDDFVRAPAGSRIQFQQVDLATDALKALPAESSQWFRRLAKPFANRTVLLVSFLCGVIAAAGFVAFTWTPDPYTPGQIPASNDVELQPALSKHAEKSAATQTVRAQLASPAQQSRAQRSVAARDVIAPSDVTVSRNVNTAAPPAVAPQQVTAAADAPIAVSDVTPAVLASSGESPTPIVDQVIYTRSDNDVQPPRLLSEPLPTPTIGGWTTESNVIELLVSETGAVEHARFMRTPQRMPDMLVLSRAKMWRFTPAVKDGRPVRYRLVLTWEVNP